MGFIETFKKKKILITGASGFIGTHLTKRFTNNGIKVHAISRKKRNDDKGMIKWWQNDLLDFVSTRELLKTIKPDIIFHLSALAVGDRSLSLVIPTYESNLTTTINLLTAATEVECQRIILSGSLEEPDIDTEEIIPSSPYAASKWACSAYGRMFYKLYNTPVVILRIFMVYGPNQPKKKLIPYVIESLLNGMHPKISSGTRKLDWIYIDDVIDGILFSSLAQNIEGRTIDIGTGVLTTIRAVVKKLVKFINPEVKPLFGSIPDRPMEQIRAADVSKTKEIIGWEPKIKLDEGLKLTIQWYKTQLINNYLSK